MEFIRKNKEVCPWSHLDMASIKPKVIMQRINIEPSRKLICQKRRKFRVERNEVINEEVCRLLEARCIKQVQYPD